MGRQDPWALASMMLSAGPAATHQPLSISFLVCNTGLLRALLLHMVSQNAMKEVKSA